MATLAPMPPITIDQTELALFGNTWTQREVDSVEHHLNHQESLEECSTSQ